MAGMANDAERIPFLKCSLSDRPFLMINLLSFTNKNYRVVLTDLMNEYVNENEIIEFIFQDLSTSPLHGESFFSVLTEFISKNPSFLD